MPDKFGCQDGTLASGHVCPTQKGGPLFSPPRLEGACLVLYMYDMRSITYYVMEGPNRAF